MPSGFKYVTAPEPQAEERYDVQSGVRRRGVYVLQTDGIPVGSVIPTFAPVYADKKNKKAYLVRNAALVEAATATDTAYKVGKGTLLSAGAFVGNGAKGGEVVSVDTSNALYDVVTLKATLGVVLPAGTVLTETATAAGTKQKYVANSALYERKKVEDGINTVALLRTAAEIEPSKLDIPFSAADKAALQGWFDFNE